MQDLSHLPQELHLSGSTLIPPEMEIAFLGQPFSQIPHSVHIWARISALTDLSKMRLTFRSSGALTDTCPPPKSLALPIGSLSSAISYSPSYLTSPIVRSASAT